MRIENILDADIKAIEYRKFNICIGISLGNKYFTKPRVKEFIEWALRYTKNDVLVWVADLPHAVNFEILKGYTKERAEELAIKKGQEIINSVQKIINSLPKETQSKVYIANWNSISRDETTLNHKKAVYEEFKSNPDFKLFVLNLVKKQLDKRCPKEEYKIERLASYALEELSVLINGIRYGDKAYTLMPYPQATKLNELIHGLQNNELFPKLAQKLLIINKLVMVEAYTE